MDCYVLRIVNIILTDFYALTWKYEFQPASWPNRLLTNWQSCYHVTRVSMCVCVCFADKNARVRIFM